MSAVPPLSVILVCRNPGPRLSAALESVWRQRHAPLEVIVIDGGSTDGTVPWLEERRARLAVLVSEPDGGVYEAMNKGVARARGDWVYFIGADDHLRDDGVLERVMRTLRATPAGVVVGEIAYNDGRIYRLRRPLNVLARNFVHHQGAFYRRSLFRPERGFDTSLAVQADYDFNLRLWREAVVFEPTPELVAYCGTGGLSDGGRWRVYREEITVRHRYFPVWRSLPWDVLSLVRFLRKRFLRSFAARG